MDPAALEREEGPSLAFIAHQLRNQLFVVAANAEYIAELASRETLDRDDLEDTAKEIVQAVAVVLAAVADLTRSAPVGSGARGSRERG